MIRPLLPQPWDLTHLPADRRKIPMLPFQPVAGPFFATVSWRQQHLFLPVILAGCRSKGRSLCGNIPKPRMPGRFLD